MADRAALVAAAIEAAIRAGAPRRTVAATAAAAITAAMQFEVVGGAGGGGAGDAAACPSAPGGKRKKKRRKPRRRTKEDAAAEVDAYMEGGELVQLAAGSSSKGFGAVRTSDDAAMAAGGPTSAVPSASATFGSSAVEARAAVAVLPPDMLLELARGLGWSGSGEGKREKMVRFCVARRS